MLHRTRPCVRRIKVAWLRDHLLVRANGASTVHTQLLHLIILSALTRPRLAVGLLRERSMSNEGGTNSVSEHILPVKLHLKRFALFCNSINSLAEVLRLEVCPSFRALVFFVVLFVRIDALVVCEVHWLLPTRLGLLGGLLVLVKAKVILLIW